MFLPTLIMGVLAVVLLLVGWNRGESQHIAGLKGAGGMLLQMLPLLIFALIVANMVQVLVPREAVSRWIGAGSGWRGLIIGSIAGGLSPGGPFINLPIAAGLLKAGGSIGVTVAFLTGWSLLAVSRLPLEIGIMGWKFWLARLASTFIFPPLAGFIAQTLFGGRGG